MTLNFNSIQFKTEAIKKALERFIRLESSQINSFEDTDFELNSFTYSDGVEFWLSGRPNSKIKFKKGDVKLL